MFRGLVREVTTIRELQHGQVEAELQKIADAIV